MASSSSSSSGSHSLSITISFRGTTHTVTISSSSTLQDLQTAIEDLTNVPPSLQKLLYKGKKLSVPQSNIFDDIEDDSRPTLADLGLKDQAKIQLLGSTANEVEGLRKEENDIQRRERIMHERARKAPIKPRSTGSGPISSINSISSSSIQYRFHSLLALQHLPNPAKAHSLLEKLSNDPAILHVMAKHRFSVGLLTELAPHEHPELLGLNVNAGQSIKLRLRTDRYDGLRTYKEVRRVLCHELTHNKWGDHDENFKTLNSQLNREVAEYERSVATGTHHLDGESEYVQYMPSSELEREAHAHTLGETRSGASSGWSSFDVESQEERRRKVLEATMKRLQKEEEEIEHSCGTGKAMSS